MSEEDRLIRIFTIVIVLCIIVSFILGVFACQYSLPNPNNKLLDRLEESPNGRITMIRNGRYYTLFELEESCTYKTLSYQCEDMYRIQLNDIKEVKTE